MMKPMLIRRILLGTFRYFMVNQHTHILLEKENNIKQIEFILSHNVSLII